MATTKKSTSKKTTARGKRITSTEKKIIDTAAEKIGIARAASEEAKSKQPRFAVDKKDFKKFFNSIYGWVRGSIFDEPLYGKDSSKRDEWLEKVVKKEPYLFGIIQSIVSIDKNRGWNLVGGRNQVKRFVNILHNFQVSPDLFGWRNGMSVSAQSYYQSDLGAVVEIGRMIENGPMAGMFTVDPARCVLTGEAETPLEYLDGPANGRKWGVDDYFRVTSMPSTRESLNGLGYCAASRCIELARLLVSVFEHDKEMLGSKAPKGILTINGMTLDQWIATMEEAPDRTALERQYYSGVQVLVSDDAAPITVALTPLSSLPEDFDQQLFVDMVIYGYALNFGYDPREFWPVSSGSLGGTGTEIENQHRRATSKGGLDFPLGFQEKLQDELPATVEYEIEQRDVQGDIAEIEFNKLMVDTVNAMYTQSNVEEGSIITREEARTLLAEAKILPDEWTEGEEPLNVSDTDDSGGEMLERTRVRSAIAAFPDEDIVVYSSTTNKYRTLRPANTQVKTWVEVKTKLRTKRKVRKVLAKAKGVKITDADVEAAIAEASERLGKKSAKVITG